MAANGVSFQLSFAREITRVTAQIQTTPEQVNQAGDRARRKTMRWLSTRMSREMSQALRIPQKGLKARWSTSTAGQGDDQVTILWFGTLPLAAENVGNPRQGKRGTSVAGRRFDGAFYHSVYDGVPRVWIRKRRAQALGLNLPAMSRQKGGGNQRFMDYGGAGDTSNRGRFPVMRVGIALDEMAGEVFRRYERRALARFAELIEQEINYVVNHERKG
ncbi:hypothetical protein FBY06_1408 [Pseudomonas sp. SJZ085]|uniref:hypothetical protein n=1 Tax=unclassified Pseudomonas TaxID=196821 RepID=UPI00119A770D|nr:MULTISPECIES: hypothetical protein [unclassified Pseudomonas]TWC12004.1 hypothetical protein FBX99_1398 [Pseudomonas sp. SJZ074]TWC30585.1 hypothetical protein FBY06_1408 [Pseudomonas sp. SJZ085]